jgi:hypothetical protein
MVGRMSPFGFLFRAVAPSRYLQLRQTYAGYYIGLVYRVPGTQ